MRSRLFFPRLLISLVGIITLVFIIALFLIHNQPFDDGGFHEAIFTKGCSTACLLGIQPGITTVEQARDRLEKGGYVYEWTEPLKSAQSSNAVGRLRWRWSNKRPVFLTGTDASLTYNVKSGVVTTFEALTTRLTFGQILIQLGQPNVGYLSAGYNDRDGAIFTSAIGYPQWKMSLVSVIQCPMTIQTLWNAPVTLQIAPTAEQTARFVAYPIHVEAILGYAYNAFCY